MLRCGVGLRNSAVKCASLRLLGSKNETVLKDVNAIQRPINCPADSLYVLRWRDLNVTVVT